MNKRNLNDKGLWLWFFSSLVGAMICGFIVLTTNNANLAQAWGFTSACIFYSLFMSITFLMGWL